MSVAVGSGAGPSSGLILSMVSRRSLERTCSSVLSYCCGFSIFSWSSGVSWSIWRAWSGFTRLSLVISIIFINKLSQISSSSFCMNSLVMHGVADWQRWHESSCCRVSDPWASALNQAWRVASLLQKGSRVQGLPEPQKYVECVLDFFQEGGV